MPFEVLCIEEPGDSLPNWITATVEVKTYRVIHPVSDSLFLSRYRTSDLGRALSQSGVVNIFQYGPNGTASLMRAKGLSPDHTQILWNQVSLNSITLGQADLSLIPMFFLDQIYISAPSLSIIDPNAGIGGTLNVSSGIKKNKSTRAWGQMEFSSLRNAWYGFGCQIVQSDRLNRPVYLQLRTFLSNNSNEFEFINPYSSDRRWEKQGNNNAHSRGLQLQFLKPCKKGNWNGQLWTIDRTTQLPSIIGSSSSYLQKQWDNQNRATYYYERQPKDNGLSWKAGGVLLSDRQNYWMYYPTASNWNDTTRIRSLQSILFAEGHWHRDGSHLEVRGDAKDVRVWINHTVIAMTMPQLLAAFKRQLNNGFHFNSALKYAKGPEKIWNKNALLDFSYMHIGKCLMQFKWQGQWVERSPDFNELYWPQSGNPNLKSEQSIGSSIYSAFEFQNADQNRFRVEGSLENRYVKNWIQWVPQNTGWWSPMNIQEVRSWHAEFKAFGNYAFHQGRIQFLSYTEWNKVDGNQLNDSRNRFTMPYVPQWKVSHQLDVIFSDWSFGCSQRWISSRFTDQSNSVSMELPAVQLWNLYVAKNIQLKKEVFNIQLKCENIMNAQYQEVRSYAIPGRVVSVQFIYPLK